MKIRQIAFIFFVIFSQASIFAINKGSETMQKTYEEITNYSKELHHLHSIRLLVSWDREVSMPKGAFHTKSEQLKLLSSMAHAKETSDINKNLLQQLIDLDSGEILFTEATEEQKVNLREWRRDYLHAVKLPDTFIQEFSLATSASIESWKKAKESNSFIVFQPHLEKMIQLCQKKAQYLGYKDHPYDALLDIYEPNLTVEKLDRLFSRLKPELIKLIRQIQKKPVIDNSFLLQTYPREQQLDIARKIMKVMTIEDQYSCLEESVHPFTSLIYPPHDIRMTTKIIENNLSTSIFSVLHEGGHTLYGLGLPEKHIGTPLGESVSTAIHESQSRLWETIIGHSHAFWEFFYGTLQASFPSQLQGIDLETFYQGINKVEPSFIRTGADEVSYCLHIIIRYEIEKALLENRINVADIPDIWNQKMHDYLGITPPSDDLGCLQDIHWSHGAFGYFPTYALGNIYAAQIFEAFQKQHPDWEKRVAAGDMHQLRSWLERNIHSKGRFYTSDDLIKIISGKEVSEKPYIEYLKNKHL